MTNNSLAGKTALITGASGGAGQAVAAVLAEAGVHLILHGCTNRETLSIFAAELSKQNNVRVNTIFADLSDLSEQNRLIDEAAQICGANGFTSPDILILAAGTDLMSDSMKRLTFEERLAYIWQVDVAAAIRIAKHFGRLMKNEETNNRVSNPIFHHSNSTSQTSISTDQTSNSISQKSNSTFQKSIIFFSWDGVEYGKAGEIAELYAAAKGAVQGFSRSFAKTVAPEIRVCCIAPGWIKTTWGETVPPQTEHRLAAESLAQRWGTAQEIAETIRFLVSSSAAFINNQTIIVNGGR
jgi:3-oxoacyl-[acyl-carrier protein] reductase